MGVMSAQLESFVEMK